VTEEPDYAGAYHALRGRVAELVRSASDEQLGAPAPATPTWSPRDLLGHLTGVTSDILTGTMEGITTDPWTAAQVDARRGLSVEEVLAEWDANSAQVEPMIPSFGPLAGQFIADAVTHEHDIRGALDQAGARDSEAIAITFNWFGLRIGELRERADAGALQVETESGTHVFGPGAPVASCRTTRFELVRASTGRRSVDQIATWSWDGDARPDLLVMPIFVPRPEALVE
jgi:uncharacterized protein (TIGR03083 family)